jgi:hypothetical protein
MLPSAHPARPLWPETQAVHVAVVAALAVLPATPLTAALSEPDRLRPDPWAG